VVYTKSSCFMELVGVVILLGLDNACILLSRVVESGASSFTLKALLSTIVLARS
jgi:hypothetical protein